MNKIASPKELASRIEAVLKYCNSAGPSRSRIAADLQCLAEELIGEDVWLSRDAVAQVCPSCATKMASLGIRKVRASVLFSDANLMQGLLKTAAWESLPEGWTKESLKEFWDSLTGDAKHKVSACIRAMEGKVDDPGAFCASAMDRLEGKGWRSER